MNRKKASPNAKKRPVRRQARAASMPAIESSRTADDVRRAEELIKEHGWEHLRDKK